MIIHKKISKFFVQLIKSLTKRENILSISFFFIGLVIYIILLHPIVNGWVNDSLLEGVKYRKGVTLNYLTPIYDNSVYAQEYSLNTLGSSDYLKDVGGRSSIKTEDPRIIAMERFLLDYNSPMAPYAEVFITEADSYGLDWRLVASISGVESAFGNLVPRDTNNGWGWRGINKNEDGWSQFATWGDAIKEITRGLSEGYGVTLTPFDIEPTYCPPCGRNPAHVWANGVTRFMNELDYYVENLDKL